MTSRRSVYKVYRIDGRGSKEYVGKTFATSEKQAVNNIRHRIDGDYYRGSNYDYQAVKEDK